MTLPSEQRSGGTPSGVGVALASLAARVRFWAPVWVPLLVFAQIALLGLRPALAEQQRLDAAEDELLDSERTLAERAGRLEFELRAERDPVYRERIRRAEREPLVGGAAGAVSGTLGTPGH